MALGSGVGSEKIARHSYVPQVETSIASWVMERTANGAEAEFLVVLPDQADLRGADALRTKEEKGRYVRDVLWNKAQSSQGPLLAWLRDNRVEHRAYYIVNLIWVKGNRDVAMKLAARPDVQRLDGNPSIRNLAEPAPEEQAAPEVKIGRAHV